MPDLIIHVGGSSLRANFQNLQPWRTLLNCADSIGLARNGDECATVELGGQRRWIAFQKIVGGCPLSCIGYQETVGGIPGGSNRKVLCWLGPDDKVRVE